MLVLSDIEDTVDANVRIINQQPFHNKILQSEVSLQLGDYKTVVRVIRRDIGADRAISGSYDDNPFINSMMYEV